MSGREGNGSTLEMETYLFTVSTVADKQDLSTGPSDITLDQHVLD